MRAYRKFRIVWIDDQFGNPKFENKLNLNNEIDWNIIFEKKENKIYRLFDIEFVFLTNYKQFQDFIKKEKEFMKDIFHYFIVDRYLVNNGKIVEEASIRILNKLKKIKEKYNSLDYAMLSSATPESFKIKDIDYYKKDSNKDFALPNDLANKISFLIRNKINLLNFTKIEYDINFKTEKNGNKNNIFPYIDIYKDFVDLQELNSNNDDVYFIVTPKGSSDDFIIQNLFIIFYEDINYYQYKLNYFDLSETELKEKMKEDSFINYLDNHQLIVIRDKWNIKKFNKNEELINKLILNSKFVYVFDEEDENLSYYLEKNQKAKILKINSLKDNNKLAEKIMFLFFDYLLNKEIIEKIIEEKNNIDKLLSNTTYKNKKLLIHPILYRAIVNQEIQVENLDDSVEIFDILNEYIKQYQSEIEIAIKNPSMSNKNNITNEKIYELVKEVYGNKYSDLLIDTIKFWLKNSWNVDYNIKIDRDADKWQEHSFKILCELLEAYNKLKKKDETLEKVKEAINIFNEIFNADNIENNDTKLISKTLWPHNEFPMLVYMINKINEQKRKQLYLQHKCMYYVNSTKELKNNYKTIENKIEYYNHFYNLVKQTKKYFPKQIGFVLDEFSEKIRKGEGICKNVKNINDSLKNDLHKLAEVFIRISYYFFTGEMPENYGELGKLLGKVRGKLNDKNLNENINLIKKNLLDFSKKENIDDKLKENINEINKCTDKKKEIELINKFLEKYNKIVLDKLFDFSVFKIKNNNLQKDNINEILKLIKIKELLNYLNKNLINNKITNDKIQETKRFVDVNFKNREVIIDKLIELLDNKNNKKEEYKKLITKLYEEFIKELNKLNNPLVKKLIELGILNSNDNLLLIVNNENIKQVIDFDENLKIFDKNYILDYSQFIFNYSLRSNLTNELFNNSLNYNLLKHYSGYPLLSLLTDFRNSSVHESKENWIWDDEKFKESFVYGYEYIWQMYSHLILKCFNDVNNTKLEEIRKINQKSKILIDKEIEYKKKLSFDEFKEKLIN